MIILTTIGAKHYTISFAVLFSAQVRPRNFLKYIRRAYLYNERVRPRRDQSLGGDVLGGLSAIPILAKA